MNTGGLHGDTAALLNHLAVGHGELSCTCCAVAKHERLHAAGADHQHVAVPKPDDV